MNSIDYLVKHTVLNKTERFINCDLSWDSVADIMTDYASFENASLKSQLDELKAKVDNQRINFNNERECATKSFNELKGLNTELQTEVRELLDSMKSLVGGSDPLYYSDIEDDVKRAEALINKLTSK